MEMRFTGESKPAKVLSKCFDVVLVNIIFVVCCLPVLTIGPACTALYYTCYKIFYQKESSVVRAYFHSFRENFKIALGIWTSYLFLVAVIVVTALTALLYVKGFIGAMMGGFCIATVALLLAVGVYLFPVLSRFTFNAKDLIRMSLSLMVTHGMATIYMTLILILFFVLVVVGFGFAPLVMLIAPALFTFWMSKQMEPVLMKYMPEEEDVDKAEKTTEEFELEGGVTDEQETL